MIRALSRSAVLVAALWGGAAQADLPAAPVPTIPTTRAAPEGVVNLNDATPDELERLPMIGPSKANAIIEHRKAHPFRKPEELMKVKGIGRKTFGKLRPYIAITGRTTLREEVATHH